MRLGRLRLGEVPETQDVGHGLVVTAEDLERLDPELEGAVIVASLVEVPESQDTALRYSHPVCLTLPSERIARGDPALQSRNDAPARRFCTRNAACLSKF